MDAELPSTLPPATDGAPPASPVEDSQAETQVASSPAGTGDSGRGRGSSTPEQRQLWRDRKRAQRLKKTASGASSQLPPTLPPSLPSTPPTAADSVSPKTIPVTGLPLAEIVPPVSWNEQELAEITAELIETLEQWDKSSDVKKARALNIGGRLLEQIEADAGIPKFCKTIWKKYLPKMAAKWLNKSGVSSEYEAETALALSALYYIYDKSQRGKEIKKLAQPGPSEISNKV